MGEFLAGILRFLNPNVLTFFSPEHCKALLHLIVGVIDFVSHVHPDKPANERYAHALAEACARYDAVDTFANFDDETDKAAKETILPFVLAFIFSD